METRSVQSRLDVHEQQISHLQFDVVKIKKSIEEDRLANREFRKVMLGWMKQQGKQPQLLTSGNASGVEDPFSGLLFEIPSGGGVHNPQKLDAVSRSEASPVISTSSVIAKLEELISKSEARASLRANLAPSPISPSIKHLPPVTPTDRNFTNYSGGLHRPTSRLDARYLANDVVGMLNPTSLNDTMSRLNYQQGQGMGSAKEIKPTMGAHLEHNRPIYKSPANKHFFTGRSDIQRTPLSRPQNSILNESNNMLNRNRGFKSLTRTEWEDRQKKGLCFRCGQQLGPAHKCPEANLRVLLLGEDESDDEQEVNNQLDGEETDVAPPEEINSARLCLALGYFSSSTEHVSGGKTFKLEGVIFDIPVRILVDCGATHNFISRKLVKCLGLPIEPFSGINVQLGDGHRIRVTQRCPLLTIRVGTSEFVITALIFDMGHLDLVFGMEWLTTLRDVIHNWDKSIGQGRLMSTRALMVYIVDVHSGSIITDFPMIVTRAMLENVENEDDNGHYYRFEDILVRDLPPPEPPDLRLGHHSIASLEDKTF